MFAVTDLTTRLINIMDRETELLNHYAKLDKSLFRNITGKNWENLDASVEKMETSAEIIRKLDRKREDTLYDLQDQLGTTDQDGFYRFLQRLPERVRAPLAASFRDMKVAVFRLQAFNDQIQGYLRSKTGTLKDVLDEIFPHQKGNMYCKQGKTAEPDTDPVFISHHL